MAVAICVASAPNAAQAAPAENLQAQVKSVDIAGVKDTPANKKKAIQISEGLLGSVDPGAYFAGLKETDKALFTAYSMPADTKTEVEIAPLDADALASKKAGVVPDGEFSTMAVGCWGNYAYREVTNAFGGRLYGMRVDGTWCSNGLTVTSAKRTNSVGDTSWVGWSHQGLINSQTGIVTNQARMWVQHRFVYGSNGWVVQTSDICLRLRGYFDARAYQDFACSLY
ncbi:hypothetical protein [Arthrobacter sp. N1]|uniref:hypothetical protein n=1 Tax=Arthrobacter sp. N1 TaxID=619291 RepID=UPI003BAF798D